jgi:tetratricopeptide (TPR) repeat protein
MRRFSAAFLLFLILAPRLPAAQQQFPIAPSESQAVKHLEDGYPVRARETAQAILEVVPDSFVALYVMGVVNGEVEGSLPRAHFYLQRAKTIIERRWGQRVPATGPWLWHNRILWELISVAGNMDHREEQLELLRLHDRLYEPEATASYGWPLMKLGRMEEGRRKMAEALQSDNVPSRLNALNVLGAMETESDQAERAYEAFQRLLAEVKSAKAPMNPTYLRNAGAAALGLQKYEEGERLLFEATRHFQMGTFSNPWKDLAKLYISQGRFPEALSAVREMQAWSHGSLPSLEQQSWAERQAVTAALLEECGFPEEALNLMQRVMNHPDRRGGTSTHTDQSEAGNLVFYRHLLKVRVERLGEEMSWCPVKDWPGKLWQRFSHAMEIWASGRRAAALTVRNGRLGGSVRFYAPDSIDVLDSMRPELNEILGAGVTGAEAGRILRSPESRFAREKPLLLLMLGESELDRGLAARARSTLEQCVSSMPKPEVLLRARAEALLGSACEDLGDTDAALNHYQQAMQRQPGVLRSLGFALPVRIQAAGGSAAAQAAAMLRKSPRFRDAGQGFTIHIGGSNPALSGSFASPDGTVLCQVAVAATNDPKENARLFCAEFHRRVFAVRLDLAQSDIASLEGSNLTGETVRSQIKDLFRK